MIDNIYKLGFNPHDIKYIIHSHGHYDHLGGTRALVELTGAKTFIGKGDVDYANGKLDLTWAAELGVNYYESFEPDVVMNDGDRICLGETEIEIVATPGHTPGTVSMFFDVTEDGKTYKVAMHGGVGTNSMETEFLQKYNLAFDCREKFISGLDKLMDREVDIFIGNHVWNNDTKGRYEKLVAGDRFAFVDPGAWKKFLINTKENALNVFEK